MSFRTIVIKNRSKLDLNLNYLVSRGETEVKVFIPEISILILESTAISLTTALISALIYNNTKIIFCDGKHNPQCEVLPFYGVYNSSKTICKQIKWSDENKQKIWTEIVRLKIAKQIEFLKQLGCLEQADMIKDYLSNVEFNDETNREGHSAKVYFNAVFGKKFNRRSETFVNTALNYGYSIILSCINREIVSKGYLTQIGIWHKNEYNEFNLACDLIEPFRTLVDRIVYDFEDETFDYKTKLLDIFNLKLTIDGKSQFFENAVAVYVQSVLEAIETGDESLIKVYE